MDNVWNPYDENAYVITPDNSFFLDKGQIDVGIKSARCNGCRLYKRCFGIRENYVIHFGDNEINPI